MHSETCRGIRFHFNPDLSDEVLIVVTKDDVEGSIPGAEKNIRMVHVDGAALLEFIANRIRDAKVTRMEQAPTHEVIGVAPGVLSGTEAPEEYILTQPHGVENDPR